MKVMSFDHNSELATGLVGGVLATVTKTIIDHGFHLIEIGLYGLIGGFLGAAGQWLWKHKVAPRLKSDKNERF